MELQANEARVAFVENGQTVFYDLPADQIRRAGIEVRNQPFQMDEIETKDEHGSLIVATDSWRWPSRRTPTLRH